MKPPLVMSAVLWREGRTTDVTLPCYWWNRSTWQSREGVALTDVDTDHILVSHGSDVAAGDRVLSVTDHQDREVFDSDDFRVVDHIIHERTHLDCVLKFGRTGGARY